MPSKIVSRIERGLGFAGLVEALARLPASDFRSLLMETCALRAAACKETALMAQAARDPLLAPGEVSPAVLMAFDRAAFEAAAEFEAVELSPVSPFGANHVLGGASQNSVLTALRNVELPGDSTVAMAIECARRRRSGNVVRLCASHRLIRLQPFDGPGFTPHFRLFAMVTAGRDAGSLRFELAHLSEHVRVYLRLFRALQLHEPLVEVTDLTALAAALAEAGVARGEVRESVRAHWLGGSERFLQERGIPLPADARHPLLESEVFASLRSEFPEAEFRVNQRRLEGFGYYRAFALRISPLAPDGIRYPVTDGGFTDWTARLMGNRKERLLISGIGSELVCKKYRP